MAKAVPDVLLGEGVGRLVKSQVTWYAHLAVHKICSKSLHNETP